MDKKNKQYSLSKIITIWLCSALPMLVLAFVVTPLLIVKANLHPGILYWIAMIVGMIWQFILSLIILKSEGYKLKWSAIRKRLRFTIPESPKTGKRS